MPLLSNPKHEIFAQEVAKGVPAVRAFVVAGYRESHSNASRLMDNDKVQLRVHELQSAAAERAGVTVQRIADELEKIGFADPRKVMEWGPEGLVLKKSTELSVSEAAMISEVAQTKDGMKIKLHSKLDALTKLGQHLGMFKEDKTTNINIGLEALVMASYRTDEKK